MGEITDGDPLFPGESEIDQVSELEERLEREQRGRDKKVKTRSQSVKPALIQKKLILQGL